MTAHLFLQVLLSPVEAAAGVLSTNSAETLFFRCVWRLTPWLMPCVTSNFAGDPDY